MREPPAVVRRTEPDFTSLASCGSHVSAPSYSIALRAVWLPLALWKLLSSCVNGLLSTILAVSGLSNLV
jgi:hypothetical protein